MSGRRRSHCSHERSAFWVVIRRLRVEASLEIAQWPQKHSSIRPVIRALPLETVALANLGVNALRFPHALSSEEVRKEFSSILVFSHPELCSKKNPLNFARNFRSFFGLCFSGIQGRPPKFARILAAFSLQNPQAKLS